jgi:cysteine desulfurase / selenocysteine lyase
MPAPRTELNSAAIRKDFPILGRTIQGNPLVYLDSAATSQKPHQVIERIKTYYECSNANVHRSVHALGEEATALYEDARDTVCRFIHAPCREGIIFTRGTTEAINLVASSWGRAHVREGDEILLTETEHHSNLIPWQLLAREKGARLVFLDVGEDGQLRIDQLESRLTEKTRLVAVTQASNVLGTINPVRVIVEKAHAAGTVVLVDAAQAVPHMPIDVQALGCDFLAFSGHKMLGPTGIGVLYGKSELLEEMPPFLGGGEMIREVWLDRATWNRLPLKFEAGTPNVAAALGLATAMKYLEEHGIEAVLAHGQELVRDALSGLSQLDGVTIYGPTKADERVPLIAFNCHGIHPHDLAAALDEDGIAVRAGHHCAQPLMRRLGVAGTVRASFYLYNTSSEVHNFLRGVQNALAGWSHLR